MTEFIYTLAFLVQIALCYSYGLAFFLKPRLHVAALFIFLLSTTIRTASVLWQLYSIHLLGKVSTLPYPEARAFFLLISSAFFLYTTWRENN